MEFKPFYVVLAVVAIRSMVLAFPNGAPDETHTLVVDKNLTQKNTCIKMDPSVSGTHKGGDQGKDVPFRLTVDKKVVYAGEEVKLKIIKNPKDASSKYTQFKGFLVQGINQESKEILGTFEIAKDDMNVKKMTCSGTLGSSITHSNNNLKSSITLNWKAPNLKETTCVKFYATVVAGIKVYWVKQTVNLVQVEKASAKKNAKSNFACKDVDCENDDCILHSTATSNRPFQINTTLFFSAFTLILYGIILN